MAISGVTIDYGPCALWRAFDPAMVYSSIDTVGHYAYGNQPVRGVSSNGAGSSAKGLWSLPSVVCGAWVTERPQLVLEVVGLGEVVAAEQVDVIVDKR